METLISSKFLGLGLLNRGSGADADSVLGFRILREDSRWVVWEDRLDGRWQAVCAESAIR